MSKIIFHVDVNNAFLSWTAVYLLQNGYSKDIRTISSAIAGDPENRHGIILAKSPIAKKYGVKTAETIYLAKKKCPDLQIFLPVYDFYALKSREFVHYLKKYTPLVEQASIDECFMDLTNTKYLYDDIMKLAYQIKREIKENFGYTVNIGIANSKLCAKMASDFEKPDKIHTLFDYEIEKKMWPLPIDSLLFVGKSSKSILEKMNIKTIGDLAKANIRLLEKYFKNQSNDLINRANGIDNSSVIVDYGLNKCISISRTLKEDTKDEKVIKNILLDMSDKVGIRARKHNQYAKTIAITFKTSSFKSFSHQLTLINPINNTMEIYKEVLKLLKHLTLDEDIRSIGIRLADLENMPNMQMSLFEKAKGEDNLQKLMDDINSKYKNTMIGPAVFYNKKDINT